MPSSARVHLLAAKHMQSTLAVILVIVAGLPGSALATDQKPDRREQFIANLRTLGSVHVDERKPGRPVVTVRLSDRRVNDDMMDLLSGLPEIRELGLSDTRVTSVGLRKLRQLKGLQKLSLSGVRITDVTTHAVGELTQLRELSLTDTRVTDAGIRPLRNLSELRRLDLDGVQITDDGLSELAMLTNLETLLLQDTRVNGTGLARLSRLVRLDGLAIEGHLVSVEGLTRLKRLRTLFLTDTGITDQGFVCLKDLPNLERLILSGGTLTDRELAILQGLPHLMRLDLPGVSFNLSAPASERLKHGIPGLEVSSDICGGGSLGRARRSEELRRRQLVRQGFPGRVRLAWKYLVTSVW